MEVIDINVVFRTPATFTFQNFVIQHKTYCNSVYIEQLQQAITMEQPRNLQLNHIIFIELKFRVYKVRPTFLVLPSW